MSSEKTQIEPLLTVEQATKILQVNRSTLWRFQSEGLITYYRIGNAVRYRRSDLEAFINAGERKAAVHAPPPRTEDTQFCKFVYRTGWDVGEKRLKANQPCRRLAKLNGFCWKHDPDRDDEGKK